MTDNIIHKSTKINLYKRFILSKSNASIVIAITKKIIAPVHALSGNVGDKTIAYVAANPPKIKVYDSFSILFL